ncbi:MAG: hypothetical protein JSR18_06690 [Proteobacteria bacterium]|nr:hypothetical protein [Pseudomonadota bacterium]
MLRASIFVAALLLAGCATTPPPAPSASLFHDDLFAAPTTRITGDDVFTLSPAMQKYVQDMDYPLHVNGPARGLIALLYSHDELKLDYDAEKTRTAAETFAARQGNCLSLVILTAALAKKLGVPIQYQRVLSDEYWSRAGDMYFASLHVNVTLNPPKYGQFAIDERVAPLTVDFIAQRDLVRMRAVVIDEDTIIAMYMNNRAAESLAAGDVNNAYWWARAAIAKDPDFLSSYNTLGVIYRKHDNLAQAEDALRYAMEREHDNTLVMSNLALVYRAEGKQQLASALDAQIAHIGQDEPFFYLNKGIAAMRSHDYRAARDLFEKEARRDPYYHETQAWLALAYLNLGDVAQAREHMAVALQNSTTRGERAIYAAKLDRLNATSFH